MTTTPTVWLAEFLANLDTAESQTDPVIVGLSNGNFLVTWEDLNDSVAPSDGSDIVGSILDARGNLLVAPFQLNASGTAGSEGTPAIAADANGGFVVVYETFGAGGTEILWDRYDASGQRTGGDVVVGGGGTGEVYANASVGFGPAGGFVVTYQRTVDANESIRATAISASGERGSETVVRGDEAPAGTGSDPRDADTVVLANGIVVTALVEDDGEADIEIRGLNADGSIAFATEVTNNGGFDGDPHVASLSSGGLVVVWMAGLDVVGRVYAADGSPVGAEVGIATGVTNQNEPEVIGLEDGGFFVAWDNDTDNRLEGQRFDASGTAVGETVLIDVDNPTTGSAVTTVELGLTTDGRILVTWRNGDIYSAILDPREAQIMVRPGDGVTTARQDGSFVIGSALADVVYGGAGNDRIYGYGGNDTLIGEGGDDVIAGGIGNDLLGGADGNDTVVGGQGADQVYGAAGNDRLDGAEGNDTLVGGAGDDVATGGDGNDRLFGSDGDDLLGGGLGDDVLSGEVGNDRLFGSAGADVLAGNTGNDSLVGGAGNDTLLGDVGADTLLGDGGNDILGGGAGNDLLRGGEGNDRLFGADGADTLAGNAGDDSLVGGEGNDTLLGDIGADTLLGDGGNDLLGGGGGNDLLGGGAGNDVLYGAGNQDRLFGAAGSDTLFGGFGLDTLSGGDGADVLDGGAAADVFVFNLARESTAASRDTIVDFGDGDDIVDLSAIDANLDVGGDQAFAFIGSAGFSGAGQLRFVTDGTDGFLVADVDGTGPADTTIRLQGVTSFTADDVLV